MNYKLSKSYMAFQIFNYTLLIITSFIMLYPIIYSVAISLSDPLEILKGNVTIIPKGVNIEAYKVVFASPEIFVAYLNTILYTVSGVLLTLLVTVFAAYPLAQSRFIYGKIFSVIFLITMFFSGGMIPRYLVIDKLGLMDSRLSVILPNAFQVFYILIMRTSFKSIPSSLSESAFIDGANDMQILVKIMFPLTKSMLAAISLFSAISYWNAYIDPLLFLTNSSKFPLTLLLNKIIHGTADNAAFINKYLDMGQVVGVGFLQSLKMATLIVSLLPIALVYPFIQKYFVKGVMLGSVKG